MSSTVQRSYGLRDEAFPEKCGSVGPDAAVPATGRTLWFVVDGVSGDPVGLLSALLSVYVLHGQQLCPLDDAEQFSPPSVDPNGRGCCSFLTSGLGTGAGGLFEPRVDYRLEQLNITLAVTDSFSDTKCHVMF